MLKSCVTCISAVVPVMLAASAGLAEPLGRGFVFQGELRSFGSPAAGPHDLRFVLFDASSGGTQVGPTLCVNDVNVADGRFTVSLDFGDVFDGQKRFLAIEARADAGTDCSDASGFTALDGRQELTASPHAAFSLVAGDAGALGGQPSTFFTNASNLTSGTLNNSRLASQVARTDLNQTFTGAMTFSNAANIFSGSGAGLSSLNAGSISTGSLGSARLPTGGLWSLTTNLNIDSGTLYVDRTSNRVGILNSAPTEALQVGSFGAGDTYLAIKSAGGNATRHGIRMRHFDELGGYDIVSDERGASLGLNFIRYYHDGVTSTSASQVFFERLSGNVGIGTTSPGATLDVVGNGRFSTNTTRGVAVVGTVNNATPAEIAFDKTVAGATHVAATGYATNRGMFMWCNGSDRMNISPTTGNVGVNIITGLAKLHVDTQAIGATDDAAALIAVHNCGLPCGQPAWTEGLRLANANGNGRVGIGLLGGAANVTSVPNAWIGTTDGSGNGHIIFATRTSGALVEQVRIRHDGITEVKAIQINGGADIVEGFTTSDGELAPGTVVVIDPDRPGTLRASADAYDAKVAGIVSGANGVSPGLSLGQDDLNGDTKVAMTGRVYVRCSTENGLIRPGDRLTTAALPGHAMKATDSARSDGAVIGKAMSSLDSGEGFVLVLVNLQ